MDETAWRASRDPRSMLAFLRRLGDVDAYKLRLFVCACWRPRVKVVIEPQALLEDIEAVEENRHRGRPVRFFPTYPDPWEAAVKSSQVGIKASAKKRHPEPGLTAEQQAGVLRDIFGNPFHPVSARPEWLTSDVVGIARLAYAQRAFDVLPILADALEDAGCDSPEVLAHCRESGPHVRGCWVVGMVLGGRSVHAEPFYGLFRQ